jgi:hypothetical protein
LVGFELEQDIPQWWLVGNLLSQANMAKRNTKHRFFWWISRKQHVLLWAFSPITDIHIYEERRYYIITTNN